MQYGAEPRRGCALTPHRRGGLFGVAGGGQSSSLTPIETLDPRGHIAPVCPSRPCMMDELVRPEMTRGGKRGRFWEWWKVSWVCDLRFSKLTPFSRWT